MKKNNLNSLFEEANTFIDSINKLILERPIKPSERTRQMPGWDPGAGTNILPAVADKDEDDEPEVTRQMPGWDPGAGTKILPAAGEPDPEPTRQMPAWDPAAEQTPTEKEKKASPGGINFAKQVGMSAAEQALIDSIKILKDSQKIDDFFQTIQGHLNTAGETIATEFENIHMDPPQGFSEFLKADDKIRDFIKTDDVLSGVLTEIEDVDIQASMKRYLKLNPQQRQQFYMSLPEPERKRFQNQLKTSRTFKVDSYGNIDFTEMKKIPVIGNSLVNAISRSIMSYGDRKMFYHDNDEAAVARNFAGKGKLVIQSMRIAYIIGRIMQGFKNLASTPPERIEKLSDYLKHVDPENIEDTAKKAFRDFNTIFDQKFRASIFGAPAARETEKRQASKPKAFGDLAAQHLGLEEKKIRQIDNFIRFLSEEYNLAARKKMAQDLFTKGVDEEDAIEKEIDNNEDIVANFARIMNLETQSVKNWLRVKSSSMMKLRSYLEQMSGRIKQQTGTDIPVTGDVASASAETGAAKIQPATDLSTKEGIEKRILELRKAIQALDINSAARAVADVMKTKGRKEADEYGNQTFRSDTPADFISTIIMLAGTDWTKKLWSAEKDDGNSIIHPREIERLLTAAERKGDVDAEELIKSSEKFINLVSKKVAAGKPTSIGEMFGNETAGDFMKYFNAQELKLIISDLNLDTISKAASIWSQETLQHVLSSISPRDAERVIEDKEGVSEKDAGNAHMKLFDVLGKLFYTGQVGWPGGKKNTKGGVPDAELGKYWLMLQRKEKERDDREAAALAAKDAQTSQALAKEKAAREKAEKEHYDSLSPEQQKEYDAKKEREQENELRRSLSRRKEEGPKAQRADGYWYSKDSEEYKYLDNKQTEIKEQAAEVKNEAKKILSQIQTDGILTLFREEPNTLVRVIKSTKNTTEAWNILAQVFPEEVEALAKGETTDKKVDDILRKAHVGKLLNKSKIKSNAGVMSMKDEWVPVTSAAKGESIREPVRRPVQGHDVPGGLYDEKEYYIAKRDKDGKEILLNYKEDPLDLKDSLLKTILKINPATEPYVSPRQGVQGAAAMKELEKDEKEISETREVVDTLKKYLKTPTKEISEGLVNKFFKEKRIIKEQAAKTCKIINKSDSDTNDVSQLISNFYPYAQKRLGFDKPVSAVFISDKENMSNPLGKTAYYNPSSMQITLYVDGRHPKDILRSFSHELVHHSQNCRGEFDREMNMEPGYAQKDPHLRKMEAEAYLLGNGFLVRDYEDYLKAQLKENIKMNEKTLRKSIRENLKKILMEKTTLFKEGGAAQRTGNEDRLRPGPGTLPDRIHEEDDAVGEIDGLPCKEYLDLQRQAAAAGDFDAHGAGPEALWILNKIQRLEIKHPTIKDSCKAPMEEEVVEEDDNVVQERYSWTLKKKNNMLFEKLTKKWSK